ncbi:MAG: carbohydrate kinase family protein [Terriglobales bacterium]
MPRFDVTVAGELNLDLILYGLPRRRAPEREYLATDCSLTLGSSSAIFAHNLACLGNRVGFASRIGDDLLGHAARRALAAARVDVSQVKSARTPPSGVTIVIAQPKGREILTYPGAISALRRADLDLSYLSRARHFHLASYFLHRQLRPQLPRLFASLRAAGLTTSLDTNDDPEGRWDGGLARLLPHVDVLFFNAREAAHLRPVLAEAACPRLLVVTKRGARGAVARRGRERWSAPAVTAARVDTVGAGDSFDAGFIHQFIRGAAMDACLRFANRAGALSITRAGGVAAFCDHAHARRFMRAALG